MSKISILRKHIVEKLNTVTDESLLTAVLIFVNQASKSPTAITMPQKAEAKKAKAKTHDEAKPQKTSTKTATEVRVLEYTFKDKPMLAVQANGKPNDELLKTLRDLKEAGKMRFYQRVPENPFGNDLPFWSGKADESLKAALMAVA